MEFRTLCTFYLIFSTHLALLRYMFLLCVRDFLFIDSLLELIFFTGMVKYAQMEGITGKTMVAITSGANMDFDRYSVGFVIELFVCYKGTVACKTGAFRLYQCAVPIHVSDTSAFLFPVFFCTEDFNTISCFYRLRFVSERADSSETLMSVSIPERAGAIREFYKLIYPRNVTELSYRWSDPKNADIIVSLQTLKGHTIEEDKVEVLSTLTNRGYKVLDFSDNELAKAHIRHLAGGRPGRDLYAHKNGISYADEHGNSALVGNSDRVEKVYRFEFPEAPGALGKFLFTLTDFNRDWNISLFHYRNHGHDYGRVLVGILVPREDVTDLDGFLEKLKYRHYEESDNLAFQHFLK